MHHRTDPTGTSRPLCLRQLNSVLCGVPQLGQEALHQQRGVDIFARHFFVTQLKIYTALSNR